MAVHVEVTVPTGVAVHAELAVLDGVEALAEVAVHAEVAARAVGAGVSAKTVTHADILVVHAKVRARAEEKVRAEV